MFESLMSLMHVICDISLMHAPINIPSLSLTTETQVDMNKELIAHGYANVISGLFGGLQNYLCYCNS